MVKRPAKITSFERAIGVLGVTVVDAADLLLYTVVILWV